MAALFVSDENSMRGIKLAEESDAKLVQLIITATSDKEEDKIFCSPLILQSVIVTNNVNQKSVISLNNRQYLYVFGDNIASMTISGLVVNYTGKCKIANVTQDNNHIYQQKSGPILPLLYYSKYAISSAVYSDSNLDKYIITVLLSGYSGSSAIKGFLVGSQVTVDDPATWLTKCTFTFVPIRSSNRNFSLP